VPGADGRAPLPPDVLECAKGLFGREGPPEPAKKEKAPPKKAEKGKAKGAAVEEEEEAPPDPLAIAVEAATAYALSFACPPDPKPDDGPPGLREGVWQQAELLLERIKRIEAFGKADAFKLARRHDQVYAEMEAWVGERHLKELAVNEAVTNMAFEVVENEDVIEEYWEIDGIILHVDPSISMVPLEERREWRCHHQYGPQWLQHPEYAKNLPTPPPAPKPLDLPHDRFNAKQPAHLHDQMVDAYLAIRQVRIPPPPGYAANGMSLEALAEAVAEAERIAAGSGVVPHRPVLTTSPRRASRTAVIFLLVQL